ncbi:regulator of chromosome condensation (RCC1) family with FYVE zinc finger domain-containing protein [Actinidia rufa]|uniref:Regulator of chromosome condensation (RCC1) family with FYVE zinc finger domain-containing protein n=1 Tax=Actinidia rufa TaxID=165716 RepID=A0A7J0EGK6_9ERIC|nr:regulator of chromosome condensation (RCC1) family with FYVE zinc finger domain-containing protein [Actinidia rufa]
MADLVSYGNADRDIEQALSALKKGTQLLKYGRKGKPKFCPFRLSNDETSLIWISSSGERSLKLASVSRIIPGQRTAVFQRYLRPEKDYLSFSLIYNNGKRSLDLICKDKVEAESWIAGLKSINILWPSVSSAPSTSSHGSAPDDCDALGDVYIWGEATRVQCSFGCVHHISCGVRHTALVTRQGELFTWGEESGGRLGHGVGKDVTQPRLVEPLAFCSVDFVACGEFHTCAVTMAGELYSWGDGTHNAGILGHGTDVSHWIPKRISGPLEGLQISMVTCGPWHTALITSMGQLFTFGDGTFGVLGHGNRESISYPREVDSLSGLRTVAVACGVWHTAAIVEVIVTQSSASVSSGKLFTWGDGDKNRLGHGDKEPRLEPTCVPALIDYNFQKIACGHSLTVGLTTSGHVFTMGSTVYGQLGNPLSVGKVPCLVEDKLVGESVEEIACGAYHVAALTSKNEVYTWGKGANGRLGHGDIEDRKMPTLVEALKERPVKFIACGSNYTTAICLHKWVSGAEQSQCSACRQAFGFTRKRHNCYNCGLVHCHACSSRKALRAALAPNPGKPYRVCDSCYAKLSKVAEAANINRRSAIPRLSGENKDRLDKAEMRLSKSAMPSNLDLIKQLDNKAAKQGKKADTFSLGCSSQAPSLLQLKDVVMATAVDLHRTVPKPVLIQSGVSSRSVSPFSRKPSPPRSATPVPTTTGLSFSKSIADSLKKTNELLNQEIHKLRAQVETLRHRCERQELELQQSTKKTQELKDMAERLPPGVYDADSARAIHLPNGLEPNGIHHPDENGVHRSDSINGSQLPASTGSDPTMINGMQSPGEMPRLSNGSVAVNLSEAPDRTESGPNQDGDSTRSRNSSLAGDPNQVEAEWIEQYEPGVYITLVALRDGTRDLKRVRFSRRRFGEHQAETWWSENREKVYERYNVRGSDKSSVSGQTARRSEGGFSPSSQI